MQNSNDQQFERTTPATEATDSVTVVSFNGHTFDLKQVTAREVKTDGVTVTFRNGDTIQLNWRDPLEQRNILRGIGWETE